MKLARWCVRYAPATNTDGADGLWIDITGAAHLQGGETALLADLRARLAKRGFTARLGLADTPGAAWALARFSPRGASSTAAAGREALCAALDPLPVEGLRLEADAVMLLKRLGLKRIGQLRALPRATLQRRFPSRDAARAVLTRLDQALGHVREPLTPLEPLPCYSARLAFSEPLISHEGVEAALKRLASDLCASLARGLAGARAIAFTAWRSDGGTAMLRAGFAAPCRDPAHMQRLLGEKIATVDAGAGIDLMILAVTGVERLSAEQASFAANAATRPLERLIDRLSNRLTPGRIARPAPQESHVPERAACYRPAIHFARSTAFLNRKTPERPSLLLEPPEPIDVVAEVPEGPPLRFTWRRAHHRILRWEGPERIAGEWWRLIGNAAPGPLERTRDYYRIEDEAGARFWVFRAGLYQRPEDEGAPRWYLHGVLG